MAITSCEARPTNQSFGFIFISLAARAKELNCIDQANGLSQCRAHDSHKWAGSEYSYCRNDPAIQPPIWNNIAAYSSVIELGYKDWLWCVMATARLRAGLAWAQPELTHIGLDLGSIYCRPTGCTWTLIPRPIIIWIVDWASTRPGLEWHIWFKGCTMYMFCKEDGPEFQGLTEY